LRVMENKPLLPALPETRLPFWVLLCLLLFVSPARGEEDDLRTLELYNGASVDVVSVDRSPRPASQTAENITVVTASEIAALNAHTLADILYTVTGVQIEMLRTPGTTTNLQIQGSKFNHILVLIDNVPINMLSDNVADISSVPVQMIERIEVVKGAASSSWGSALGGVVNVITKSPDSERPFGGLLSASLGKRETVDGRAEVSGTLNRFGYYLTGGKLRSDGLLPNNHVDLNSAYGKLNYDLPVHGSLSLTTALSYGDSGQVALGPRSADQEVRQLISTLSMQYPLADRLALQWMLRTRQSKSVINRRNAAPPTSSFQVRAEESAYGASLILSWLDDLQRIVAGVDYDHVEAQLANPLLRADDPSPKADRVGVYLNDTFTLGALAITPSARFDHTDSGGDLFSPSFGITYALTDNTVLRAYTARGYSLTSLTRTSSTEKVWTSQFGFETADVPYLWLKGTLFRNDTWDISVQVQNPANPAGPPLVVKQSQLKQGYELELKTTPLFGTSLSLGYTYIDAWNDDTDAVIRGVPRHTLNLGVKYEDRRYLRALLNGHYIDWNGGIEDTNSHYGDVIWDLHLAKSIDYSEHGSVELFLSVRNLFNGNQYLFPYENPERWGEVGVRCEF